MDHNESFTREVAQNAEGSSTIFRGLPTQRNLLWERNILSFWFWDRQEQPACKTLCLRITHLILETSNKLNKYDKEIVTVIGKSLTLFQSIAAHSIMNGSFATFRTNWAKVALAICQYQGSV